MSGVPPVSKIQTPITQVQPATEPKVEVPKKKKEMSEKQKEALKVGQTKIKELASKRAEIKQRNKEREEKKAKGEEVSSDEEAPAWISKGKPKACDRVEPPVRVPLPPKSRALRKDTGIPQPNRKPTKIATRDDMENMMKFIDERFSKLAMPEPKVEIREVPVEKIVEKIVEKPVVKERRLSGSALLDEIFFKKQRL